MYYGISSSFKFFGNYETIDTACTIIVSGHSILEVQFLRPCKQIAAARIPHKSLHTRFVVTVLFMELTPEAQQISCGVDYLTFHKLSTQDHWVLTIVRNETDRKGGVGIDRATSQDFVDCIDKLNIRLK